MFSKPLIRREHERRSVEGSKSKRAVLHEAALIRPEDEANGVASEKLICKVCREDCGTVSDRVVKHLCTNVHTGKQFTAYVCERCLDSGRETRVTCRTFIPVSVAD
jgi:hypothetical protein